MCLSHQEGAEHVEADEVVVGEVGAARIFLPGRVVRLWVTQLPVTAGQQDLLPGFPCGTPEQRRDAVGPCVLAGSREQPWDEQNWTVPISLVTVSPPCCFPSAPLPHP